MTGSVTEGIPRVVRHRVTVRHAATGRHVPGLRGQLLPPSPWWWSVRTLPGVVVVHADQALSDPDPERTPDLTDAERLARRAVLRLTVDPLVARTLTQPSVDLVLTTQDLTHEFTSGPQTVTVVLVTDSNQPATGQTVTLAPTTGPAIATTVVEPGTYRTAARVWAAGETTFDLLVGTKLVRRCALAPFQLDTRIHAVAPA